MNHVQEGMDLFSLMFQRENKGQWVGGGRRKTTLHFNNVNVLPCEGIEISILENKQAQDK